MLNKDQKAKVVKDNQKKEGDTGSSAVQIALLTTKITLLTEHLKRHRKDDGSRRGLIGMVQKRRKLLSYIKKKNIEGYQALIEKLGLKR